MELADGRKFVLVIFTVDHASEREIIEYLESFRYRIGPDDEKAVGEYRRLLALLEG